MPKILNVSRYDVTQMNYDIDASKAMLISINDPDMTPPEGWGCFKLCFDYYFLDLNVEDKNSIDDWQADLIAKNLKYAYTNNMDVVVHCTAGICRSGAVAEVAEMIGFEYIGGYKQPNTLVKYKLMKQFGLTYE